MSGINFKTPIIYFLSIVFIAFCALPEYEKALDGFISKPLFVSSGFVTLVVSLLLLYMQSREVKKGYLWVGEILSYAYGIFTTIIIALMVQNREFSIEGVSIIVLSTLLLMLVASSIEKKFEPIDKFIGKYFEIDVRNFVSKLCLVAIICFIALYIWFRASEF